MEIQYIMAEMGLLPAEILFEYNLPYPVISSLISDNNCFNWVLMFDHGVTGLV